MKQTVRSVAVVLALAVMQAVPAAAEEFLLYSPTPQQGEPAIPHQGDGVLVKRRTIVKGDTLTKIARENIGQGSYYPQILLFNDIANPNLIYAGKTVLVPVVKPGPVTASKPVVEAAPVLPAETQKKAVPVAAADKTVKGAKPEKKVAAATKTATAVPPAAKSSQSAEQTLYAKGISEYNGGHYQQALNSFSRFIEKFPNSPLMPDAKLYKAESLLNLSNK